MNLEKLYHEYIVFSHNEKKPSSSPLRQKVSKNPSWNHTSTETATKNPPRQQEIQVNHVGKGVLRRRQTSSSSSRGGRWIRGVLHQCNRHKFAEDIEGSGRYKYYHSLDLDLKCSWRTEQSRSPSRRVTKSGLGSSPSKTDSPSSLSTMRK